jgi:hypothetical protein
VSQRQQFERCPAPAEVLLACEGELPFAEGQRVSAHLRSCARCQDWIRSEEAIRAEISIYLSRFDADRPSQARSDEFDRNLLQLERTRSMHLREGWASRRVMATAAVVLIVVTGMALPSAQAEGLGGVFTRIAAAVRQTLSFGSSGGGLRQTRVISKSERSPAAVPAPAAATAEAVDSVESETARQAAATSALAALPDRDTLDLAELEARLVLSDASLDLLRGVHVSSTQRAVRVEGVIPAPRRRVVARLNALPYVRVSLRAGPAAESGMAGAGGAGAKAAPQTGLARWVDYRLGDRPEKQTFVPELARLTTAVIERVHTLSGLAERYSDDAVKEMSPAARAKLQKLLDRHYQSLSADLDTLDARFAILFGSTTRVFPMRRAPADWQHRVNSGFAHAASLDRSLRDLFTLDDLPPVAADEGTAEGRAVTSAFGALWDAVHSGRP